MYLLCAAKSKVQYSLQRAHVLQLLALVEDADALPANAALRIAQEILVLAESEQSILCCDPVIHPGQTLDTLALGEP